MTRPRTRVVTYRWHLRQLMATRGMFSTTDLLPHLAERGVQLSAAQVYRLVVQTPERLNLHTLAALCDILGCTPADLIEPVVQTHRSRKHTASGASGPQAAPDLRPASAEPRPMRAQILPPP